MTVHVETAEAIVGAAQLHYKQIAPRFTALQIAPRRATARGDPRERECDADAVHCGRSRFVSRGCMVFGDTQHADDACHGRRCCE